MQKNVKRQSRKGGRPKLGIKIAQDIAVFRRGVCLSGSYENIKAKLKWQCNKGHVWSASLQNIKDNGSWCPYCAGNLSKALQVERPKLGLKIAQDIAVFRGGVCLSGSYENNRAKLKWQCNKGHEWSASLTNIKDKGTWCPYCATPGPAKKCRCEAEDKKFEQELMRIKADKREIEKQRTSGSTKRLVRRCRPSY